MKQASLLVMTFTVALTAAPVRASRTPCEAPIRLEEPDPALQTALESRMRERGFGPLIDKRSLAVSLVDVTPSDRRYYAGVNDDRMLYAASLPKIAILLTVLDAVDRDRIEWSEELDRRLQNMIVASSNIDASWGVDLVGLQEIEKTLRSPRYCFYAEPEGGLWVGRPYRRGGSSNRDPLFNISHGATARQTARFYSMLDAGQLVSKDWSLRMLGLMSPPKHAHKFVGALRGDPEVEFLARKSGTWRTFHADSALIRAHGRRFVLVGLADTERGESIMRELAKIAHDIVEEGHYRRSGETSPPAVGAR